MVVSQRALTLIYETITKEIAQAGTDHAEISVIQLGVKAGYAERTTRAAVHRLRQAGRIQIEHPRPGAPARYRVAR